MKGNRFCFAWLVSSLFLFAFASPVLSAGRGIVPVQIKDNKGREVLLYKESHALVIGVSEYTGGWPRLPGVADDVREVTKALESAGFRVTAVMDPDRDRLDKAFTDFINEYGQARDNRLLLYFAGHGHTAKLEYGAEMGYIVPADAPDPNRDKAGFLRKAMDMQMVEVFARRIQSKHAAFMFDSCFSGSLFALTRAIPQVIQEKTALPVRQFITAGTANQEVPDESLFRRMFVRALQGDGDLNRDGYMTVTELGQYLEDTVTNYSKRSQTPKYGKIRDPILDQGDFVFPLKIAPEAEKTPQELARLEPREEPKPAEKQKAPAAPGMARIPGGEFMAGLATGEGGTSDDSPRKESVRTFYMDPYEVTQAEFERVTGNNPSGFKGGNLPVENVTWREADAYCKKVGKRLPTEWEWEKAARGGTTSKYHWGDDEEPIDRYAWYKENSDAKTHPVGGKEPNGYGLHDMAGNVWEWTASDYGGILAGFKVSRGGSWYGFPDSVRPSIRGGWDPDLRSSVGGFRCAR
ncbi:MAG: SUMF1/EgtB/PvdO family nonheme iron enzyme [Nitrospinae bacterium]|nr:SUMF1/EgtB/PvdO family nonheme iron enzyme [Nitrospinota bacterium]